MLDWKLSLITLVALKIPMNQMLHIPQILLEKLNIKLIIIGRMILQKLLIH